MALKEIKVPDIGDFKDVEIIEVLVKPGDTIRREDPLITLESDKASMEVPAADGGVVKELKVKVGDKVSQGSLILMLETAAEAVAPSPPAPRPQQIPPDPLPAKGGSEAGAIPQAASAAPQVASSVGPRQPPPAPVLAEPVSFHKVHASPSVRRFARELGVDLNQVRGSGRKERITQEDVQAYVKQALQSRAAPAVPASGAGIPAIPAVDFSQFGATEIKPLSRIKRLSGPHLHRAWLNLPMVTHHDEADITELEAFRQSLKEEAEKRSVRVTLLAFVMKALVRSLKAFPQFNASLAPDGENLILKQYYHIGIAVDTPNGLVVPVIRDVDRKSIFELAAEMMEVSKRARDGKLAAKDMQGGCISISSLGGIGGIGFTPIVNAPELAILGLARSQMKPVWNGKEFLPRLMQPIDLTYDHRVIDGADGARFVVHLGQGLNDIRRLLL